MNRYWGAAVRAAVITALAGSAWAQEPSLPAIPKDCQAPGANVVAAASLPHVADILKERKKIRVLAIGGTSIARREDPPGGYHRLIEDFLERAFRGVDVQIFNRGVSGELARDAAERIKMEVGLTEADLVLWQVGTQDALAQMSVEEFKVTLRDTISWLRQHNVDVVLIGMQYARSMTDDAHYQAMRAAVQEVAKEQGVLRIGRYDAVETIQKLRLAQGTEITQAELTEAGYVCMAEYLARAIATNLFANARTPSPPAKLP